MKKWLYLIALASYGAETVSFTLDEMENGKPVVNETVAGRLERWNLEGEQRIQLGVLYGTNHPGNFQLAYPLVYSGGVS